MTVGATNNTFRNFALEMFLGCISPNEDANIPIFLAGDVIELQHNDIGLAAIDAWVRIEVVPDILALLPSLTLRTLISTGIVELTIAPVVCFTICPLAFSTIRAWPELLKKLRRIRRPRFVDSTIRAALMRNF
jgi:hypothetical protein